VHKLPKRKEQLGEVRMISLDNNLDDEAEIPGASNEKHETSADSNQSASQPDRGMGR
jgi:hypothetical protein